jgi:hypothetical protein
MLASTVAGSVEVLIALGQKGEAENKQRCVSVTFLPLQRHKICISYIITSLKLWIKCCLRYFTAVSNAIIHNGRNYKYPIPSQPYP